MKKNILLSAFLTLLAATFTFSQQENVVWSEDFEGNWYSNWYVDNGVWEVGIPTSGPNAAHGGQNCAATVLAGNYPDNEESRLVRIFNFTVPSANENPRIRFWHWYNFNTDAFDHGKVEVKVQGTTNWQQVSNYFSGNSSGVWSKTQVDLIPFAGQTIQLGFFFHSESYLSSWDVGPGWYIDDIEMVTGSLVFNNPEDWENGIGDWWVSDGTWEVGVPTSGPNAAHTGQNCAATNLSGNYSDYADNSGLTTPWFTVPAAFENPRLRFWHWYNFNTDAFDHGSVGIRVLGIYNWDQVSNDFSGNSSGAWSKSLIDLSPYAGQTIQLDFYFHSEPYLSSPDESSGWYIDDIELVTGPDIFNNPENWEEGIGDWWVSDGTWEVGAPSSGPNQAHSGQNCAATKLGGNYSDYADDSHLVSPWIIIPPASENPRLRFWHWYNFNTDAFDHGKVEIMVFGNNTWDQSSNFFSGTSSNVWSRSQVELTEFAGLKVRFGFYFHSEPYLSSPDESSGWYIDDIELLTGPFVLNNPENWETGIGDWWVTDGTWEVGTPVGGPGNAYNGENCAATNLKGFYSDYADDSRLVTPYFKVSPQSQFPRLRFWHWYNFNTDAFDHGKVQIRTNNTYNWTDITSAFAGSGGGIWSYAFADLSSFGDSIVQVGFYFHSERYLSSPDESWGWYIDDVFIEDNSMMTVDAGPDLVIQYGNSQQINATVTGGTPPLTIEWIPGTGLSNPSILTPIVTPSQSMGYILQVTDANGCFRTDRMKVVVWPFQLDIKVFLEGPWIGMEMGTSLNSNGYIPLSQPYNTPPWNYNGTESVASIPNNDIVDWVLLELREVNGDASQATPATTIARKALFVNKYGQIVDLNGVSLPSFNQQVFDNLYAVIWHRNHLGIMSDFPLNLSGVVYSYDFTTAAGYSYGGSLALSQLAAGAYGMTAADGDSDGQIGNLDKNDVWVPQAGISGYKQGDFSLDGQVNNTDKNELWTPNSGSSTQVPN